MPDYDALAQQHGGSMDLDALAAAHGAVGGSKSQGLLTGNPVGDALAGAGGEFAQHVVNLYDLIRKVPGADKILPDSAKLHQAISDATPDTTSAHVGKFLEGVTEFAVPAGKAAEATKGASLLARTAAQAGVGAGVSGIQTTGDAKSMAAGAAAGAGGELIGAAASKAMSAISKKAPTLANFSESFGNATPTQKARISRAMDVLTRDGVVPPDSVHETQDVIKGKLDELGQAYQNLDPAIKAREVDPSDVIDHLKDLQKQYTRRGVVTDPAAYAAISGEIQKVEDIAMKNGGAPASKSMIVGPNGQPVPGTPAVPGKVNVDDIVHLKQMANGKTSWNSADADKSLWRGIGDAYRSAADTLAPEITPLNRDYQKYKDLEQIIDQNIARGKGTTQSGLSALLEKGTEHAVGAAAGAKIGGAVAGVPGATVGGVVGGIAGPKVSKAVARAIQNAVDSGAFAKLPPMKQQMIRSMSAIGDNAGILKALGVGTTEEAVAGR